MSDLAAKISGILASPSALPIAIAALVSLLQIVVFFRRTVRDLTISYRIAVLGVPRSGKTALIGSMFDCIFSAQESKKFTPVGQETISRVNRLIAQLNARQPLPPTVEADVFVFRFLFRKTGGLIIKPVRYEGEVVDFPGELSQKLLDSAGDGSIRDDVALFDREFFSWVVSSKVHLFVIDLGQYLLSEDRIGFVAGITSEIRATWQLLNDEMNQSVRSSTRKVAIVFTKSDLLETIDGLELTEKQKAAVRRQGYDSSPTFFSKPKKGDSQLARYIRWDFEDLITYFSKENCAYRDFFVSSYRAGLGDRWGIPELVQFILPGGEARNRAEKLLDILRR